MPGTCNNMKTIKVNTIFFLQTSMNAICPGHVIKFVSTAKEAMIVDVPMDLRIVVSMDKTASLLVSFSHFNLVLRRMPRLHINCKHFQEFGPTIMCDATPS